MNSPGLPIAFGFILHLLTNYIYMKTIKLILVVMILSTTFYSCTTTRNNNFAKNKYFDKKSERFAKVPKSTKVKQVVINDQINEEQNSNSVLPVDLYEANVDLQLLPKTEIKTNDTYIDQIQVDSKVSGHSVLNSQEEI